MDELQQVKLEEKGKAGDKRTACNVNVRIDKAERVAVAALRALVERTARTVACGASNTLQLRITLDKTGKITKVEVLSGHKQTGEAMVRKLTGATSSAQVSADTATVELTIIVSV
jgi:hypothetical protein